MLLIHRLDPQKLLWEAVEGSWVSVWEAGGGRMVRPRGAHWIGLLALEHIRLTTLGLGGIRATWLLGQL